ncbi:MAG: LysR substrate-binding domain-containing protein [Reyranellaceae bacterium]
MDTRRPRLPSLNALKAFEASVRHRNFRLAAEELGVTQGAVAQHVRGLEADLGVSLFERLPRSLAPTMQGRAYAVQIRRAFELISEATAGLRSEMVQLTISATPTFAAKWLIPHLPEFTNVHPNLDLRILATESIANFQSDGVDIAIRQGRPPFGPGLMADLLFEQEVIAVCSPSMLRDNGQPLQPDEIDRYVLLYDLHDLWPEFMEKALQRSFSTRAKRIGFSHSALAIDAAIRGQGIAVVSSFFVKQDMESGVLVKAFDTSMRGIHDHFVVSHQSPRHPEATLLVRDWLLTWQQQPRYGS